MKDYKREGIQVVLDSTAKMKTLIEGRKYSYLIEKIEFKDNIKDSTKRHIINKIQENSRNNSKLNIPKAVNATLNLEEKFDIYKLKDWKTEFIRSLYVWASVKGVSVAGFDLNEALINMIDDFIIGEAVDVWAIEEDLAEYLYDLWEVSDFDDFIFTSGEDIYIIHFQVKK